MPAAGHIVHMPAHIYYRVGQYRRSLDTNKLAVAVDEQYFRSSPSDPLYKSAYYPHNIHFVMVSAQMGGDGATAIDAAKKLDAAVPAELAKQFQIMEPVKAAPFTTQLSSPSPTQCSRWPSPTRSSCWCGRCTTTPARSRWRARRTPRRRTPRPTRSPRSKQGRLQAVRRVGRAGQGDRVDRAPRRHRPHRRRGRRPRRRCQGVRGRDRDRGQPQLHRAAVLVLPGAPVARQRAAAPEPARRCRTRVPRFARGVRNNGWAIAGLAEVYKRKGDRNGEAAAKRSYARAWFGPAGGPDLARL